MREETYDTIIIGGGPAGLTAGLYTQRARMNALLIEKGFPGGQVLLTDRIENYPGFPEGITGLELVERMKEQTRRIGLEIVKDEITGIKLREDEKTGKTFYLASAAGREFAAMSVIIATGAVWKSLGVQGEDEFRGKGVSYCATCDAPFFKNRKIVIVGGGDKAAEEAIYLTKFANEIILIHRRNRLRAAKILQDALGKSNKIKLCLDSIVTSINGAQTVENVKVENVKDKSERQISCQGVFIFVGVAPNSFLVRDKTKLDEKGYIITGDDMRTSTEGIFACGDVRKKTLQQIVTATAEGAQAAMGAEKYIAELKGAAY